MNRYTFILPTILLIIMTMVIGIGLREDLEEAFNLANTFPVIIMLMFAAMLPWVYSNKKISNSRKWIFFWLLLIVILGASLLQPQTPLSLQKFKEPDRFWPENIHCIAIGFVVSFFASVILTIYSFAALPVQSRQWQMACSLMSGLYGLAALTIHCMGAPWNHILIAHWGQIILLFPISFLQQRVLFKFQTMIAIADSKRNN